MTNYKPGDIVYFTPSHRNNPGWSKGPLVFVEYRADKTCKVMEDEKSHYYITLSAIISEKVYMSPLYTALREK